MPTGVGSSLQRVIYWSFCKRIKEGGRLVQPIWIVCSDRTVRCVANEGIEAEIIYVMKIKLNIIDEHGAAVLPDPLRKKPQRKDVHRIFELFICLY